MQTPFLSSPRHFCVLYQSTNGGTNWNHTTSGLPSAGVDRSMLGVSVGSPQGVSISLWRFFDGRDAWHLSIHNSGTSFRQQAAGNLTSRMFNGQPIENRIIERHQGRSSDWE